MEVTGLEVYTVTYTYDERNRLITEIRTGDGRGASHFTYDNNGNLIRTDTTIWATNAHNFFIEFEARTYNALNQLTRISRPGMTAEYTYRSDGLRFRRVVNGVWTYQIWNMGQVVLELNINLQAINRFYYAMAFNHRIRSLHHGFYIYNARGDVVQRTDNNGNVLHTYQYDAFGNEVPESGAYQQYSNNPFRFGGEYWDWERGEYYLRARSYNPRLGRFTQPDPFWGAHNMQSSAAAIMQSANLFVFGMNNPGRWLDPSGMFVVDLTHNQIDDARAPAIARGSRSSTVSTPSRAAQFGQGVVSGFTGFYSGIVHAVTNPVQTITNYYLGLIGDPVGTATSILMPILPLHINAAVQTFSIANSHRQFVSAHGVYGAGVLVGEFGAQVTTFAIGYGAGKLISYCASVFIAPKPGSLTNVQARQWYNNELSRRLGRIDPNLPLNHQARQAHSIRNQVRTQARSLMADRAAADRLNMTNPNLTWRDTVARYQSGGRTGDVLWRAIVDAAHRSNPRVNQMFR